jgi:hypothetical protein
MWRGDVRLSKPISLAHVSAVATAMLAAYRRV